MHGVRWVLAVAVLSTSLLGCSTDGATTGTSSRTQCFWDAMTSAPSADCRACADQHCETFETKFCTDHGQTMGPYGEPWFWTQAHDCRLINCQAQCFPLGDEAACKSELVCRQAILESAEAKVAFLQGCREVVARCPSEGLLGCCTEYNVPISDCYYEGTGATAEGCSEDYQTWTTTPP